VEVGIRGSRFRVHFAVATEARGRHMRIMGVDTSTKTGYVVFYGSDMKESGVIFHKPHIDRYAAIHLY